MRLLPSTLLRSEYLNMCSSLGFVLELSSRSEIKRAANVANTSLKVFSTSEASEVFRF